MIGHLSIGVDDLEQAAIFYDAVFQPLGFTRFWSNAGGVGYGRPGQNDQFALKVQERPVVPPGPGFHIAFEAASPLAVDLFHSAALAAGGADAGQPGLRTRCSRHTTPRSSSIPTETNSKPFISSERRINAVPAAEPGARQEAAVPPDAYV